MRNEKGNRIAMNTNVKEVRFGTKQEAMVTPKEGYELEAVEVINTADNSVIPSELRKVSDNPAQYICSFVQPAGHVTIKPYVKPVLYSVTFEVSSECNIVLVEQESMVEVEIKSAVGQENENEPPSGSDDIAKGDEDFNQPQHSDNEYIEEGLNVGEQVEVPNTFDVEPGNEHDLPAEPDVITDVVGELDDYEVDDKAAFTADVCLEDDADDGEPEEITPDEYEDKNTLYWQWKDKFDAGECTEEKFLDIRRRHMDFIEKINTGRIVVKQ